MKITLHNNPWFSLEKHDLPDGGVYYFLNKRPGVFVVAETKQKEIVFVKEFRYPVSKNVIQLPAGMIEAASALLAAKKELLEETNLRAKKWRKLGMFYVAPGHENTKIIVYHATDLYEKGGKYSREKNIKKIFKIPRKEIKKSILEGKIKCGITLASISLLDL